MRTLERPAAAGLGLPFVLERAADGGGGPLRAAD